jgi:dihydropteroate synthase
VAAAPEAFGLEPRVWRCGRFELSLDAGPLVMGILNVTPDSFSDGGRFLAPLDGEPAHSDVANVVDIAAAVDAGRAIVEQGASIVDVGGESTRPGAAEVSSREEAARVVPVIGRLTAAFPTLPVSVDTRHADVARAALEAGAAIVNDVAGFRDPAMVELAARTDAGLVVVHMQGEPGHMQDDPHYDDVVGEVSAWLLERAGALEAAGVARERIVLDPGIGFGKTSAHNLELLHRLPELTRLGYPLLIGASRKRFIGEITGGAEPGDRVEGSLAAAMWSAAHGVAVVRVHDVRATVRALAVLGAIVSG